MKRRIITLFFLAITLLGLGMRFYPAVADWWNRSRQSHAVSSYAEAVTQLGADAYDEVLEKAEAYNARLAESGVIWKMNGDQERNYNSQLDVTGLGIMAYLDIPKISVTLPIYHGVSKSVLDIAIGHLPGTSLPVGGTGTHCSVSGHRGLSSARLFTDLGMLTEGDRFTVTVLDRTLTYEVDRIRIVLPNELDELAIDPDQDYFTLITCTPYGVNSHRILVRGRRVENSPDAVIVLAEAVLLQTRMVAFVLAMPLLMIFLIGMMISTGRQIRYKQTKERETKLFRSRQKARAEAGGPPAENLMDIPSEESGEKEAGSQREYEESGEKEAGAQREYEENGVKEAGGQQADEERGGKGGGAW